MSALNTHTDTPSHAYHAYAHTCAPTLTYIYKQIHVYTHTGTCAHTPKRHTTGRYHCPSNRLVRTLATNRGDWSAPSLVFSKPTPPRCCLGVPFALPTLKCGPQVSHVDQPSPFYQLTILRPSVSKSLRNHQAKAGPKPGTWAVKAPGFSCTST